jgi:hypothetical protein
MSFKSSRDLLGIRERLFNSRRDRRTLSVSTNFKSIPMGYPPFRERRQPGRNKGSLCVAMLLVALWVNNTRV